MSADFKDRARFSIDSISCNQNDTRKVRLLDSVSLQECSRLRRLKRREGKLGMRITFDDKCYPKITEVANSIKHYHARVHASWHISREVAKLREIVLLTTHKNIQSHYEWVGNLVKEGQDEQGWSDGCGEIGANRKAH